MAALDYRHPSSHRFSRPSAQATLSRDRRKIGVVMSLGRRE